MEALNIRLVNEEDAQLLFEWANDPTTRLNSFNTSHITWEEHINWLHNKLSDPNSKLYISTLSGVDAPIGFVKFEKKDAIIIGITIAPDQRGKGYGAEILNITCEEYWKNSDEEILAYIKLDNIASKRIFEKANFKYWKEEKSNDTSYIILKKLKNENSQF